MAAANAAANNANAAVRSLDERRYERYNLGRGPEAYDYDANVGRLPLGLLREPVVAADYPNLHGQPIVGEFVAVANKVIRLAAAAGQPLYAALTRNDASSCPVKEARILLAGHLSIEQKTAQLKEAFRSLDVEGREARKAQARELKAAAKAKAKEDERKDRRPAAQKAAKDAGLVYFKSPHEKQHAPSPPPEAIHVVRDPSPPPKERKRKGAAQASRKAKKAKAKPADKPALVSANVGALSDQESVGEERAAAPPKPVSARKLAAQKRALKKEKGDEDDKA